MQRSISSEEKTPMGYWRRLQEFRNRDLWTRTLPPFRSPIGIFWRLGRLVDLVARGFGEDRIRLHATSLTYSTLLSLLPLLAIGLAIAKGLGQDQPAIAKLNEYTAEWPQQFQEIITTILEIVTATDFARLGAIGAGFLLFTVVQVLTRVEVSMNQVWGIKSVRGFSRRLTSYISTVVVVPILLLAAITATANLTWGGALLQKLGLFQMLPYFSLWLAFTFLYQAMPNTRVHFLSALAGGFFGAFFWQIWLRFYLSFQPGVTNYNVIYGALALIPIFLIWLYVSWIIVLTGARIAYAVQNRGNYQPETSENEENTWNRILMAIEILRHLATDLQNGTAPSSRNQLVQRGIHHPRLLDAAIEVLSGIGLIGQTYSPDEGYVLLKAPHTLTIGQVVQAALRFPTQRGIPDTNWPDKINDWSKELIEIIGDYNRPISDLGKGN